MGGVNRYPLPLSWETPAHPNLMPSSHKFAPGAIKNKQKREEVFHKAKKDKGQAKLQRRLANAKREADDPKAKQVCGLSLL